ncbi:MAG: type IV toxin-antitoxin system AbiEi family antitoxin domain-containing protein [Promicromonosporaceae bacterium]|nr:type IV toxin-antitoxin system AbiEi family antitoxin domain-containing protein [Promicromonosporaceae bacterium]
MFAAKEEVGSVLDHPLLLSELPFTAKQARTQGLDPRRLAALIARGAVQQIGRGLYMPAALDIDPDLAEVAFRAPLATMCLTSALVHYGLIDDIPTALELALPSGAPHRPPVTTPVTWRVFDAGTFSVGRGEENIRGVTFPVYSPERCVVDAFRLRGYTGYETATKALKAWLSHRGNAPATLLDIARQLPRAIGPLQQALEILL